MNVYFNNKLNMPEILIRAYSEEFRTLGYQLLNKKEGCNLIVFSQGGENKSYPVLLNQVIFESVGDNKGLISLQLDNQLLKLCFLSDCSGFKMLGESLIEFFTEPVIENQHLHLDYLQSMEGDDLLSPTNTSLVFCID
jgi:hypothetical protein